jgi:hypothetical protein
MTAVGGTPAADAALADPTVGAALGGGPLLSVLLGIGAVAIFLSVWITFHAVDALIVLSPFAILDAVLVAIRSAILGVLGVALFVSPFLGLVVAIPLIVASVADLRAQVIPDWTSLAVAGLGLAAPVFGGLRWGGGGADELAATLQNIRNGPATITHVARAATPPADGKEVWDQLARHAVFREVMAVFQGRDRVPAAQAKKAAQHQLVTPYSGAVVLENQQQYDRAGLKPVDASSTPQIPTNATPEPSSLVLLVLGLLMLNQRRRK